MSNRRPRATEPFKQLKDINKIKQYLKGKDNLRDYTIFTVGINVGLRAGDLLSIKWTDVLDHQLNLKDEFIITEQKTNKIKTVELNDSAKQAIKEYMDNKVLNKQPFNIYMFDSRKGNSHLQVRSLHRIIKQTAKELNIKGNYGTHSLRKTFGYHRYKSGLPIEVLQQIFNHSSQSITLRYIGITQDVIKNAYNSINL